MKLSELAGNMPQQGLGADEDSYFDRTEGQM